MKTLMSDNCFKELSVKILQDFNDGIIISDNKTRKILDVNPAALTMFGYGKEEMLKIYAFDLHPADQKEPVKKILKRLEYRRAKYNCDVECVRKNGEVFFVDTAGQLMKCGRRRIAVGFFRERAKVKNEATDWNIAYRNLAEMVGYGVCLVSNMRIIYANQAVAGIYGVESPLHVIGRDIMDCVTADAKDEFKQNYENLISGINPVMTVKRRFIKSDGTQALCRVKASRVRVNGEWAVQMIVTVPGMEKDDTFRFYEPAVREKSEPPEKLTERETEILKLIAEGYTVKEIAGKLNISARTVRTHKCNVMCKLQIHSTANLVRYAIENNLAGI